jgi:hypothetical protein
MSRSAVRQLSHPSLHSLPLHLHGLHLRNLLLGLPKWGHSLYRQHVLWQLQQHPCLQLQWGLLQYMPDWLLSNLHQCALWSLCHYMLHLLGFSHQLHFLPGQLPLRVHVPADLSCRLLRRRGYPKLPELFSSSLECVHKAPDLHDCLLSLKLPVCDHSAIQPKRHSPERPGLHPQDKVSGDPTAPNWYLSQ